MKTFHPTLRHTATSLVLLFIPATLFAQTNETPKTSGSSKLAAPGPAETNQDSALDRGQEVRASVEMWEDRVNKKIRALDQQLKDLDFAKIEVQQLARDEFESILDDLDEEAAAIISAYSSVAPDMKLLRKALEQAPDAFREIAAEFEDLALAASEPFFRESYADFAAISAQLAQSYEAKSKSLDAVEQEITGKLEFVKQSRTFVEQVRKFLRTVPAGHGVDAQRWITRVNSYVEILQQAVRALKTMADQIDKSDDPKRSSPGANPATPKPNRSTTSTSTPQSESQPLPLSEVKARLASLR